MGLHFHSSGKSHLGLKLRLPLKGVLIALPTILRINMPIVKGGKTRAQEQGGRCMQSGSKGNHRQGDRNIEKTGRRE